MGQTKSIDLPEPGAGSPSVTVSSSAKSRWWLWALALGVVALVGWYYRSSKNASQAADPAAAVAGASGAAGHTAFVPSARASVARLLVVKKQHFPANTDQAGCAAYLPCYRECCAALSRC